MKRIISSIAAALMLLMCIPLGVSGKTVYAVKSDIIAYIDGLAVQSWNIDGHTYISAEMLSYNCYYVSADYDDLTLKLGSTAPIYIRDGDSRKPFTHYKPENDTTPVGTTYSLSENSFRVYITDVTGENPDIEIPSYNLDGLSIVRIDDLAPLGKITWDAEKREIHFNEAPPEIEKYTLWMPYLKIGEVI
nr:hypothetical protein [Clostridia bacterium]